MENAIPIPIPKDKSKKKKKTRSKAMTDGVDSGGDGFDESKRESLMDEIDVDDVQEEDPSEEQQGERTPTTLEKIQEILNPSLKIPESKGPYKIPDAVKAGDVNALQEIDEQKVVELKELFTLVDTDADGILSPEDLRVTMIALGKQPTPETIEQMLTEALSPLDFDAFVALMACKMIELDPEDVLLEAWSKWDLDGTGVILEERIFNDLITFGDKFTEKEAHRALDEAPLAKAKTLEDPPMIDYQAFCRTLGGIRRRKQPD